jgi:DUF971 family protein
MSTMFSPSDIHVDNDAGEVQVAWGDGHKSALPIDRLRGYCPCAECQGHGGELTWIEHKARGITGAEPVGRYAILFQFDDGHTTGIYRWEYLRKLDPTEAERWGPPESFARANS